MLVYLDDGVTDEACVQCWCTSMPGLLMRPVFSAGVP